MTGKNASLKKGDVFSKPSSQKMTGTLGNHTEKPSSRQALSPPP